MSFFKAFHFQEKPRQTVLALYLQYICCCALAEEEAVDRKWFYTSTPNIHHILYVQSAASVCSVHSCICYLWGNMHFNTYQQAHISFYLSGQDDYDRLRPLSYQEANLILVCFDVTNPTSFENVHIKVTSGAEH